MGLRENIKLKRFEAGFTLEDLAQKVGTSRQTIQRYESGVISNIPFDRIEKIADALGTTPAFLTGWKEDVIDAVPNKSEEKEQKLIDFFQKLNDEGMDETLKRIEELTLLDKYQK